jgi:hypothetical protein
MKLTSIAALTAAAIFASTLVSADNSSGPRLNVDASRHPRLAEAQDLVRKAFNKVVEATRDGDLDPAGHAAKAMDMLVQVNQEIAAAVGAK